MIVHTSVKHRKDFIIDMFIVNLGVVTLDLAMNETFEEGTKNIHRNKFRKEVKKIREVSEYLQDKREKVLDMVEYKDLKTIDHKTKGLGKTFIDVVAKTDKDCSLELLAVCFLEYGLKRKRKTPLNEHLKCFCDISILFKVIAENIEKAGIEISYEWDIAKEFIDKVKY